MPSLPKNYPFYNWVPKPLGILILILLFVPILTASGVYTANSGEMLSGLGIQSEHIQFVSFLTSVGMAAFSPFFYGLVCLRRGEDDVYRRVLFALYPELHLCQDRQYLPAGRVQCSDGFFYEWC